jgi:hypothetical protein
LNVRKLLIWGILEEKIKKLLKQIILMGGVDFQFIYSSFILFLAFFPYQFVDDGGD